MWTWLAGCAPLPAVAGPLPLPDGAVMVPDGHATVWIGPPTAQPGEGLRVWLGAPTDVDGHWVAVPGADDLRSARARRAFAERAAAGGPGDLPATWRHVDLAAGGETLRLVTLPGGGPDLADAESWLPKILGGTPTVVVIGYGDRAEALRALARRHSSSLLLVVWPGDGALLAPDGRFGELLLRPGDGAALTWTGAALEVRGPSAPLHATWTADGGWVLGGP